MPVTIEGKDRPQGNDGKKEIEDKENDTAKNYLMTLFFKVKHL